MAAAEEDLVAAVVAVAAASVATVAARDRFAEEDMAVAARDRRPTLRQEKSSQRKWYSYLCFRYIEVLKYCDTVNI